MPAQALYQLCRKACIKNIRSITDVGDIPYDLIRPILIKLENPEQLRLLEESSPQLCGADAELWLAFIKRDIPNWESQPHEPKNPKNWYKVYRKLRLASQQAVDRDALILKEAMEGIKTERAKHTSKVVDPKTVPRLPRMGGMRAEGGRSRSAVASHSGNTSVLTFTAGSKTKGVIDRARREAKEMSLFSAKKSILAVPTHKLVDKATHVRHAPQGLVEDHRRPAAYTDSPPKPTNIIAPRKRTATGEVKAPDRMTVEEREKRLRALTNPASTAKTPSPTAARTQSHNDTASIAKTPSPPSVLTKSSPITLAVPVIASADRTSSPPYPSTAYVVPRRALEPDMKMQRPMMKQKAPVDIFMPAKRRKIS